MSKDKGYNPKKERAGKKYDNFISVYRKPAPAFQDGWARLLKERKRRANLLKQDDHKGDAPLETYTVIDATSQKGSPQSKKKKGDRECK